MPLYVAATRSGHFLESGETMCRPRCPYDGDVSIIRPAPTGRYETRNQTSVEEAAGGATDECESLASHTVKLAPWVSLVTS